METIVKIRAYVSKSPYPIRLRKPTQVRVLEDYREVVYPVFYYEITYVATPEKALYYNLEYEKAISKLFYDIDSRGLSLHDATAFVTEAVEVPNKEIGWTSAHTYTPRKVILEYRTKEANIC